jgi:hypothetical protein
MMMPANIKKLPNNSYGEVCVRLKVKYEIPE